MPHYNNSIKVKVGVFWRLTYIDMYTSDFNRFSVDVGRFLANQSEFYKVDTGPPFGGIGEMAGPFGPRI